MEERRQNGRGGRGTSDRCDPNDTDRCDLGRFAKECTRRRKRMACVRTPRVFTRAAPGLQRAGTGRPRLRLQQAGDKKTEDNCT